MNTRSDPAGTSEPPSREGMHLTGTLTVAGRVKWIGIVLLVPLGLFQLHLPHYLIESSAYWGYATYPGVILLAMLLASLVAVAGIYRNWRWGWLLGILVAGISWVLYLVQETGDCLDSSRHGGTNPNPVTAARGDLRDPGCVSAGQVGQGTYCFPLSI